MFELIVLPNEQSAQVLLALLKREGLTAQAVSHPNGWQVLVTADDFARAREVLQRVLESPVDVNQQAWQQSQVLPKKYSAYKSSASNSFLKRFGPVALVGTALSLLVYLSPNVVGDVIYRLFLFADPIDQLALEPWRLFTPALLHFSVLHLTFNLIWWLDLGTAIEKRQSSWRLIWVALVVAASSNIAQFYDTGANFGGLSGVVYGLLGYVWLYGKWRPSEGLFLQPAIAALMIGWLVLCMTGMLGPVANTAHVVGLISGLAIAALTICQKIMLS